MSTAVVLSFPAHGHVTPTLPVVAELVRRGERVIFYATEGWQEKVEPTGSEFRCYSQSENEFNPTRPPTEGLFSDMARLIGLSEAILPNLLADLRSEQPDYLLLDSKSIWGNLVGQILGIPRITLSVVFAIHGGLIDVPTLVRLLYNGAPGVKLLAGLQSLSQYVERAKRIAQRYGAFSPDVIDFLGNPQALNIIFTSREFQVEGHRFDERYKFVGPSLGARQETTDFPFDGIGSEPLVYISLGTVFNDAVDFYRACFEAFAGEPWRVVLSFGNRIDQKSLGETPANFIVRPFVPQLEILQRASLFVTHGGMNGVNEALFYQVPLIVVPQRGDQYVVATRVETLGVGLRVLPQEATPQRLRAAAAMILSNPEFGRRAKEIGASLQAGGGYKRAADEIFAFKKSVATDAAAQGRMPARATSTENSKENRLDPQGH